MGRKKVSDEMLEEIVLSSLSMAQVLQKLGLKLAGGSYSHYKRRIVSAGIDSSHFTGQSHMLGKVSTKRKYASDYLVRYPEGSSRIRHVILKRCLLELGVDFSCAECGLGDVWNNKILSFDVDHIDGDFLNNLPENLRFLCPNCHSQQADTNMPHKFRVTGSCPKEKFCRCGVKIATTSKSCRKHTPRNLKIDYPELELIIKTIQKHQSWTLAEKELGIGQNSIRKHLTRNGIEISSILDKE